MSKESVLVHRKYMFRSTTIFVFLLLQPVIDMITSLNVRFFPSTLTFGVIVRTAFMVYIVLLVMSYKPKSRLKNAVVLYFMGICIFGAVFLLLNIYYKGVGCLLIEIKGLFRSFYFPVVLVGLIFIFKNIDVKISQGFLTSILFGYTFIIFFATITGTYFYSYGPENFYYNTGSNGWFYAANEIGTVIGILLPYAFLYVFNITKATKKRTLIFNVSVIATLVFSVLVIATKVPLFSAIGYLLGFGLLYLIYFLVKKEKKYLYKSLCLAVVFLLCSSVFIYTPSYKTVGHSFSEIFEIIMRVDGSGTASNNSSENEKPIHTEEIISVILNDRNVTAASQKVKFSDSTIAQKIMGMGISCQDASGNFSEKTVEQDFGDMFFRYGLLGSFVFLISLAGCLIYIFLRGVFGIKKAFFSEEICTGVFSLVLALGVAALSGHTLLAPAVSIYIVLDIIYLIQRFDEIGKKTVSVSKEEQNN